MKKVTIVETLVMVMIAGSAFAAWQCDETGRNCTETVNEVKTVTVNIDEQVQRKRWLKQRNEEIASEVERDTARYVTEPNLEISRNTEEISDIDAQFDALKSAGANITEEDQLSMAVVYTNETQTAGADE